MVQAGTQLGPYRLLRRIGSGGMAEVFLAQRIGAEGFSRTVAIKTILALGSEEEGIGLFLDEARVAASLEHPAIVQTLDLGYESETLFIVMEYIAGPSLSRILKEMKKQQRFLPWHLVAHVGARMASALDFAYNRATSQDGNLLKLIHRDISPQNIMLTRDGLVKLTDFGVARASIQTHRTRTGQVRGKAAYMAPEQVRAKALDGRTDVFALGLVLYEALTSTRAYQRQTDIMSMRAILTDPVKPMREINPAIPEKVAAVVMKALEKSADARYQTAGELEAALKDTARQFSDSSNEGDIKRLLDDLFGAADTYNSEEGLPVEAWQPTMASLEGQEPVKLGSKLSPKVAEMLREQLTPSARSKESITPDSTPMVAAVEDDMPQTPSMYSPASQGSFAGQTGVEAPFSMPGMPGQNVTGYMLGQPGTAYTQTSLRTQTHASQALLRFGVPLLGLSLVGLGFVGWQLITAEQKVVTKREETPSISQKETAPMVSQAVPKSPPPPPAVVVPPSKPKTSEAPPPQKVTPPPPPPAEPPKKTKPKDEDPAAESKALLRRVVAARSVAKEKGDADLAKSLGALMTDLGLRPPTDADRKAVNDAEKKLGL
jgi:serine/threonine protein kinase